MTLNITAAIIIGYLLGSIPFSYIIARRRSGVDIRDVGGGNAGALNTFREIGPLYGIAVLFCDIAKGALAVLVTRWLGLPILWVGAAGFAAVVGHNWPVYIKFRGGKGAATTMGVLIPLLPGELFIGLGIAVVVLVITSNVRLGIIGLAFIPLFAWLFDKSSELVYISLALLVFLVIRTLVSLKGEMARVGEKNGIIFDKDYTFWQTRKNRGGTG